MVSLRELINHEFYQLLAMLYKYFRVCLLCFEVFLKYLLVHECLGAMW